MEDNRLQVPVYWNELGEDCQADLVDEFAAKFGFSRELIRKALENMDRSGKEVGHVVVYEYDIKMEMGWQGDEWFGKCV